MADSTKTILLADDSVTIQKVVELTFMDEDFKVSSVNNGAEAIARLGEMTPDVLIADVHMPGADGYEVCRRSKELHPSVPVLLLVGTFESFDAEAATRSGADGHLKKPFDSQELLRRVRELAASTRVARPAALAAPEAAAFQAEPAFDAEPAFELAEEVWEPIPEEPGAVPFAAPAALPALSEPEELYPEETFAPLPPAAPAVEPARPAFSPVPAATAAFAAASMSSPAASGPDAGGDLRLSDDDVDRIARRVIELLGDKPVRDVAWEVVPDLAEVLLKSRIRELEASVE